jgi:putative RNA 2'-phosphotransferase
MKRHHVHLSVDKKTATIVGARHGSPVILTIDAGRMHKDGFKFFVSDNGVWLVDCVPVQYIRRE